MHLDTWTSFFLPVIPSSMDRLNTSSYMSNYNEHRYIANIMLMLIYYTSVSPRERDLLTWGSPSLRFLLFPLRVFFFFLGFSLPGWRS